MKNQRITLTEGLIGAAICPPDRNWKPLWDARQPGLLVRVYPTGTKTYYFSYRVVGGGRKLPQKWLRLGSVDALSLKDARDAARIKAGEVAKGRDPAAERRQERRRSRARLESALDRYEESLRERGVVKRREVLSLLRRELLAPFGNIDITELDRAALVDRIDSVRRSGRPGAARELRTRAGVFLGWAADQGLVAANPLAGWRQQRRTRAERLSKPGRALRNSELAGFWHAAGARGWPFGPYLQMLLLLGQRRTETSLMAWSDLIFEEGMTIGPDREKRTNLWIVRPEITKSGRAHCIPLPRQAVAILRTLPRLNKVDLVFPGRKGRPMAGWSRRLPDVYVATARAGIDPWTPHDLRRTMRTGVGKLGVEPVVAELLLDHAISDDLARIYDLGDYWQHRVDAAQRWADHVFAQMPSAPHHSPSNVVELTERR